MKVYDAVDGIAVLTDYIARHSRLLAVTGAGLSTASGIPDYRNADGTRRGRAPVQGPAFRSSEAVRRRYWARSMIGWPVLAQARPNAGHHALATMEAAGRLTGVITQNVDGLHIQAGSRRILELHGNIHVVVCLNCGMRFSRASIQPVLEANNPSLRQVRAEALPDGDALLESPQFADFRIPDCPHCKGVLQPDVVFFGDLMPAARRDEATRAVEACDALLVVGSSLMVHSAYRLCTLAAQYGKPVVAINLGVTRADDLLALKVHAAVSDVLPHLPPRLAA